MKSVLITGASSGIGRAIACRLDAKGYQVFAGVRKESDADSLKIECSTSLIPVMLDVEFGESIKNAFEEVKSICRDEGLFAIINNAGISTAGPLEYSDLDEIKKVIEVNLVGMIDVTKHFLPLVRQFQDTNNQLGHVINIGSVAGLQGYPLFTAYNASKFAVKGFSEALRLELQSSGINVSLIEAGAISTNIWNKSDDVISKAKENLKSLDTSNRYKKAIEKSEKLLIKAEQKAASPVIVANLIQSILESQSPKFRYLVGPDSKLVGFATKWIPEKIRHQGIQKEFGFKK